MIGRIQVGLLVLVLLLVTTCVAGGVLARQRHADRSAADTRAHRYGDVLGAARDEATAFVNIRYDDAQASIDAVAAGATGKFRDQYAKLSGDVERLLTQNKSVMTGKVVWSGVSNLDKDSAVVLAATTGTVSNVTTSNRPVARNYALKLSLVRDHGVWLTDDIEFVS